MGIPPHTPYAPNAFVLIGIVQFASSISTQIFETGRPLTLVSFVSLNMGSSCSVPKATVNGIPAVLQPTKKVTYAGQPTLQDMKAVAIGPYFLAQSLPVPTQRRIAKWLGVMNAHPEAKYPLEESDQGVLKARVKKGPPQAVRWQAWIALRKLSVRISESDYQALPQTLSDPSLLKDLARSFPAQAYFSQGKGEETLGRVLGKLAAKHTNVGYCQGLNFVAGFMLLVSGGNEVETFYLLEDLLDTMHLSGLYTADFPYLRQCMFVLAQLLHTRLPRVSTALEEHGVGQDCWMAKWFLTLFVTVLPLPVVIRVWDSFIVEGPLALFKAAVALLSQAREELLSLEGLAQFFSGLADRSLSSEKLLKRMSRLKFTNPHLKTLEKMFQRNLAAAEKPKATPHPPTLSRRRTLSSAYDSSHLSSPPCPESPTLKQSSIPTLPPLLEPVLAREVLEQWLKDADEAPLDL